MKLSAILAPLLAAKADPESILEIVRAYEDEAEQGKEKARVRWRTWDQKRRSTNASKRLPTLANDSKQLVRGDAHVEDKTLTSENTQKEESKTETRDALSVEFDTFWSEFPNKTGKPKARSSFTAARRKADMPTIMAGLARYVATKPPDRPWLNPATFLNQERWADQPATVVPFARGSPPGRVTALDVGKRLLQEMQAANGLPGTETSGHQQAPLSLPAR